MATKIDTRAHVVNLYTASGCSDVVFSLDTPANAGMLAEGWRHTAVTLSALTKRGCVAPEEGKIGRLCLAALRAGKTICRGAVAREDVLAMNTKKDYQRAAAIVRAHDDIWATTALGAEMRAKGLLTDQANAVREAFVAFFRADNPHFDVDRFRVACGPDRTPGIRYTTE